jgi:hypothetical protein
MIVMIISVACCPVGRLASPAMPPLVLVSSITPVSSYHQILDQGGMVRPMEEKGIPPLNRNVSWVVKWGVWSSRVEGLVQCILFQLFSLVKNLTTHDIIRNWGGVPVVCIG